MGKKKFLFLLYFLSFLSLVRGGESYVMLQGFQWDSVRLSSSWWNVLKSKAGEIKDSQIDIIWFPPSSDSLSDEGYLPRQLYVQDSKYGTSVQLVDAINTMHSYGIKVIGDVVLNHRVGFKDWADFKNPDWGLDACTKDDEYGKCTGNYDTGKPYEAARDIDHTQKYVRDSIKEWLLWLRKSIGYDGWRYDYARGFAPQYFLEYNEASFPIFSVAEIWDDLDINNVDSHRQKLCDWMDAVKGKIKVFDFTTKGVLQYAISTGEYWRLADKDRRPSGLIGWWPANAVTFIENHDTEARQTSTGHKAWPFPSSQLMQGYAYILTHPGIPCIFWPHLFDSGIKKEIIELIKLRKRYNINSTSSVNILVADTNLYAANIDNKVIVKIGSAKWAPDNSWKLLLSGNNYAVWGK